MKEKIPVVYIEWLDHTSKSEWQTAEEAQEMLPTKIYTVGFLVNETKDGYKVSLEVSEDADCGDTIYIVKSAVVKFKKLKIKLP